MAGMRHDDDELIRALDFMMAQIEDLRTQLHRHIMLLWAVLLLMAAGQAFFNAAVVHWIYTVNPVR